MTRRDLTFLGLFGLCLGLTADRVSAEEGVAAVEPVALRVEPGESAISGRRETRQLIASAVGQDNSVWDVTRSVEWVSLDPEIATVDSAGKVRPVANGLAKLVARTGSLEAQAQVVVSGMDRHQPVSFRNDAIAAFSQANCNMGACHGTPTGKGGFRLSLRGYLPDQDYQVLTREAGGRRIDTVNPDASLILAKPLGLVAHEGGLRLRRGTKAYEYLRDWVAEGAHDDPAAPKPVRLEIALGSRVLNAPAKTQQLAVVAHYADGTSRDVTEICWYDSSSTEIAEVDPTGFVQFKQRGEAAIIAHYHDLVANVRLTHLIDVPGFQVAEVPEDHPIDRAVFAKLNRMRIPPSELCTDEEFIRRVYLDTIGVLPTPEEVRGFLADPAPDRRTKVIDGLLQRPEFNDFWALKFADVLRSNSRLIQTKGAYAFHRWIREQIEKNRPLDDFVRELITAEGSSFQNPAVNYFRVSRDPETSVETTAQLFLGVRIQCAKCHNHPFERWTQDDYYGFAAFFSRDKRKKGGLPDEEIVYNGRDGEVRQPRTGRVMPPKALGGPVLADQDHPAPRRNRLADWLVSADNPFFAKSMANRIWFHLMGRGVVEPVDDFRDSNPPSNDELLDTLASELVRSGYDLRQLVRLILTSRTYQLSARPNPLNADDSIYFSHALTRLLPAEVLLDAISTVTGTTTAFANLPAGARATQIPDGQLDNPFLKTFGRPARELACECERESDSNLSQALQLIGGSTVNGKLRDENGRMAALARSDKSPEEITRILYEIALCRQPTSSELAAAVKHLTEVSDRRQAVEDLGWVLINTKEFLFRH
ncbi:MAG: surface protein [Isosphaeraceae bacterium]|jgi:hypothetical protein|nr:MAG: surface protein [Isosphaeraceae bacterium]